MEIPKKIKDDIWEYCRLNDISNIDDFIIKLIRQGFTSEKYGSTPLGNFEPVEVERIVEIPVEIVKEVIVEKEIIKEIPVEKIVTKIEYISDKENENELFEKIEQLDQNILQLNEELISERKNFSTKTEQIENSFQKEIDKKEIDILNLTNLLETEKTNHSKTKEEVIKKDKEIDNLKKSLEEEKKKINKKDDIYGDEPKGGWFGSNLLKR